MRSIPDDSTRPNRFETHSRRVLTAWPFVLLALAAVLAMLAPAGAGVREARGSGIAVQSSTALSTFPNGIVFRLSASSDARISRARLLFQVLPTGPITAMSVDCSGDTLASCSKTVGGANGIYIVPFTQVRYSWEIKDESGGTYTTQETTVTYDDTRFNWKSLSEGNLTVYYYDGDEKDIREVLRVGRETIDRMSQLEGTLIDFPVKVLDYASARDLQPAVASSRMGGNGITLGEVSSADTAIETRQTFSGSGDALDTVRHELAHIVTDHATRANPNLDVWINEGISVWAETRVDSGFKNAIERAIRNNTALSLPALSVALRSNNPNLFYGQSHSVVKYLIDTYGEARFTSLIRALNAGLTNAALKTTYGIDGIEALEDAWRESVGLPARPLVTASNAGTTGILPTIVPFGAPGGTTRGTDESIPSAGSGDETTVAPAGRNSSLSDASIAAGAVTGAVLLGLGVVVLRRSRRPPEALARD